MPCMIFKWNFIAIIYLKRIWLFSGSLKRIEAMQSPVRPLRSSNPKSVKKETHSENLTIASAQAQTPYELRTRIKQRICKMVTDEAASESEDECSFESDSGSSIDEEISTPKKSPIKKSGLRMSPRPSTANSKTRSTNDESMKVRTEEFFRSQSSKRSLTSDNTLSKLELPQIDRDALRKLLQDVPEPHKRHLEHLMLQYKAQFHEWEFQLSQGFNLLLHGLGSKIPLLEEFRKFISDRCTVVLINGFFPSITIKQILNTITEEVLEHRANFKRPEEQATYILQTLPRSDIGKLVIIINSIDGVMLRDVRTQGILCSLAESENIHMLASVDHINAPLLWDQRKMNGFNWLWKDVTNFIPYTEETSYENSLLVRQSGALALSSLSHVFNSLTPNAKGIFILLAQYQLDHKENDNNYLGMAFQDCYQQCREAFLVNSELTLKAQLTEFKDHKLLKAKKGADGEHLTIPLDSATITEFLRNQDKTS